MTVPLDDALKFLSQRHDVTIARDPGAATNRIARGKPITLRVTRVTLRSVLGLICDDLGLRCEIGDQPDTIIVRAQEKP